MSPAPVGRAAELDALATATDEARRGHPQVVVVDADAGMGKSTLVESFLESLDATGSDGIVVHRALCDSYEQDVPFGLLELLLGEPIAADADPVAVARQLLRWLADEQGDDRLVVLALDDVQWMDRASVDALRFALRRLRADRVVTVLARRPPAGPDPWSGLTSIPRLTTSLHLRTLTAADIVELAAQQRGWRLSTSVAQHIVERTGGHPLLVHAFVTTVEESRLRDAQSLPRSVTDAARRLLAHLDVDARTLVDGLAVLDQPVGLAALQAVAGVDEPTVALASATRSIAVEQDVATGRIRLSHDLIRKAVYDDMPADSRRTLHRRAVEWTSGERRLGHRVAAADRTDPALAAELVQAAQAARDRQLYAVAATNLIQARSLLADPVERDRLLQWALLLRLEGEDLSAATELRPRWSPRPRALFARSPSARWPGTPVTRRVPGPFSPRRSIAPGRKATRLRRPEQRCGSVVFGSR